MDRFEFRKPNWINLPDIGIKQNKSESMIEFFRKIRPGIPTESQDTKSMHTSDFSEILILSELWIMVNSGNKGVVVGDH